MIPSSSFPDGPGFRDRRHTVVVTGAAGMVGQNLVPRLIASGYRVVGLDKSASALRVLASRAPEAELHAVDLAEAEGWPHLLDGAFAAIDLKAQITSPDRGRHERNNVLATSRVAAACARHRVPHLIHLSSSMVISKAVDFYTETKRKGEELVRSGSAPHTILRPPLMFGPGDIKHLGLIARHMKRLPIIPLPGAARFVRQPLYVGDLCAVIEKCLRRPPSGEVFDIIGHERLGFLELLKEIRRITRARCVFFPIPMSLFRLALGFQGIAFGQLLFTPAQLDALSAGDDFAVSDWAEVFGVRFTPFRQAAPRVFTEDDDLRQHLFAAQETDSARSAP